MPGDYPDQRPLERLLASRQYALYHARQVYRSNMTCDRVTLSFRPDVMKRVAAEAPILTDLDLLKRWGIRIPEAPLQTDCEVTLALDFWCTLDRLLDDVPFDVAPSMIMFPKLIDVNLS
jgi:hypothetical protein